MVYLILNNTFPFVSITSSTTTSKLNYAARKDNSHAFYQPKPADIIDGNALVKQLSDSSNLQKEARNARWGYSSLDDFSDKPSESSEAAMTVAKPAKYHKNPSQATASALDIIKDKNLELIDKLKFDNKSNCQSFTDNNHDTLFNFFKYNAEYNYQKKYPELGKFVTQCPQQSAKLAAEAADSNAYDDEIIKKSVESAVSKAIKRQQK